MQRALILSLIVLLAGCAGAADEAPTAGGQAGGAVEDSPVSLDRPAWAVGDWWTFTGSDGTARTWIVTDASDGYVVDIDADDFAFTDAALSDISTIGKVSLGLDGAQNGTPVKFFDWPLTDGKTWDLQWDGLAFSATAKVTEGGADIEAVSGGVVRNYSYDNKTRWFSTMESYANGTIQWGMTQTASGAGYSGVYLRYVIHDTMRYTMSNNVPLPRVSSGQLTVPEDTTDIWFDAALVCAAPGHITYGLMSPTPLVDSRIVSSLCPLNLQITEPMAPATGRWQTALEVQGVDGHITAIARTLEEYRL